jgi:hypothetical protein
MADHYSQGAQIDPTAEAELRRYSFSPPEADWGFEDLQEFASPGCRAEDCVERAYTRMEQDVDYHEQRLHPPSQPEWA